MKKYIDKYSATGLRCYGKVTSFNFNERYVVSNVFEYLTLNTGNIYKGSMKVKGIHKIGEFYVLDYILVAVLDEPSFYK